MKKIFTLLALLLASTAGAQTFSFDIAFDGCGGLCGQVVDLTGSFTDRHGVISNISIVDPGWGAPDTAFTVAQTQKNGISFFDLEGASSLSAAGSNVWILDLGFDTANPNKHTELTDVTYWHGGSGGMSCGPDYIAYECSTMTISEARTARAPEIGPNAEGFVLALGLLLLIKGRRCQAVAAK